MTETDGQVPFLRDRHHAALVGRCAGLRHELDREIATHDRTRAEAADLRDLAHVFRCRVESLEAENARLRRLLGARLLRLAAPLALAGLVGGFVGVFLLRWVGF